jgi:hypothetical protein
MHTQHFTRIADHTLEQPGVNAPGTPNTTAFLLPISSAKFTLLAGEPSNNSTAGILSPG